MDTHGIKTQQDIVHRKRIQKEIDLIKENTTQVVLSNEEPINPALNTWWFDEREDVPNFEELRNGTFGNASVDGSTEVWFENIKEV